MGKPERTYNHVRPNRLLYPKPIGMNVAVDDLDKGDSDADLCDLATGVPIMPSSGQEGIRLGT